MANCNYKVNLTDIQNKYKFKIFNTGSYNDSDLRKMIESVFYALPRTTGSGTSVTLTDTAFSYMKNKLYATDTTQDTLSGKNLLKYPYKETTTTTNGITFTDLGDGSIKISGTANANAYFSFYPNSNGNRLSLNAGTYNFSSDIFVPANCSVGFGFTDASGTSISGVTTAYLTNSSKTTSRTINENFEIFGYIYIANGTAITTPIIIKLQIENGSTATEWEQYCGGIPAPNPDYPQAIHTITGNNNIRVCGKNLEKGMEYGGINESGTLYPSTTTIRSKDYNLVEANTQYIISLNNEVVSFVVLEYDKNKSLLSYNIRTGAFTTSANTKYIKITKKTSIDNKIQLEKGSTVTTYEQYQSNAVLLTLGDIEICKIGTYEDKIFKAIKGNEIYDSLASEEKATLDYGKWYLRKNTDKLVLKGTGDTTLWGDGGSNVNFWEYFRNFSTNGTGVMSDVITNYFNQTDYSRVVIIGTGTLYLRFPKSLGIDISTVNLMNAWLSTNNTIVYYAIATPKNELFNDTIQDQLEDIYNNMLSYEGTTNVSQENADLPFNIEATAIKDLNSL